MWQLQCDVVVVVTMWCSCGSDNVM